MQLNPCGVRLPAVSVLTSGEDNGSAMSVVSFSAASARLIHEADQLISYIERGFSVLKFYPRKRPERRQLTVRRETHQIIWSRSSAPKRQDYEGSLDIRDIKEVRVGKSAKDFERWPEELKRLEASTCFTVFYGSEFKLRSASFAGKLIALTTIIISKCNFSLKDDRETWSSQQPLMYSHLTRLQTTYLRLI